VVGRWNILMGNDCTKKSKCVIFALQCLWQAWQSLSLSFRWWLFSFCRCFIDGVYLYYGLLAPFAVAALPILAVFVYVIRGLSSLQDPGPTQRMGYISRVKTHLIKLSTITVLIAISKLWPPLCIFPIILLVLYFCDFAAGINFKLLFANLTRVYSFPNIPWLYFSATGESNHSGGEKGWNSSPHSFYNPLHGRLRCSRKFDWTLPMTRCCVFDSNDSGNE